MPFPQRVIILFLVLLAPFSSLATHIVGGNFTYKHVRGDEYELQMKMYRDCGGGTADFDRTLVVGIFDKETNQRIRTINLPLRDTYRIRYNTGCINPQLRCVEAGVYTVSFNMPQSTFNNTDGYYVIWERCCRNNIIKNIVSPGAASMGFYMEMASPYPGNGNFRLNNSPEFTRDPLSYLCLGEPFKYNFIARDIDGDELRFSLIPPLDGGHTSSNMPTINTPQPAPYLDVTWQSGYGSTNMMDGNPDLMIDNDTAVVYIVPQQLGVYVISILCEEYRDGVKLGEIRRELQLEVITCPPRFKPVASTDVTTDSVTATVGQQTCFTIKGMDQNAGEILRVRVDTIGMYKIFGNGASFNPPNVAGSLNISTQFCWTPQCPLDLPADRFIDFIIYDDSCPYSQDDTVRVYFKVILPDNEAPTIQTSVVNNVVNIRPEESVCFQVLGDDQNRTDPISIVPVTTTLDVFAFGATFPQLAGSGTISGEFCWALPCDSNLTGTHVVDFVIYDNPGCAAQASDTVSVTFNILPKTNANPVINASGLGTVIMDQNNIVSVTVGEENCFLITGEDNDQEDDLEVYSRIVNYDFFANGAKMQLVDAFAGFKTYKFCWTPDCSSLETRDSLWLQFLVRDNKCMNEKFDTTRIGFRFVLPANELPEISKPDSNVYTLSAGYSRALEVTAIDQDLDDLIVLSAEVIKGNPSSFRASFENVTGKASVSSNLVVYPDCNIDGLEDYTVRIHARSNSFCSLYDTVTRDIHFRVTPLEALDRPLIPNAFSPNGDGINDYFKIYMAERTVCPGDFTIKIFDRWGKLMFLSHDPLFMWDGNGAGPGAYVYYIKRGEQQLTGFIALVK